MLANVDGLQEEPASAPAPTLRVALVHYWLVGMRGGEKVLEALGDMFPDAVIYTHVVIPDRISAKLRRHPIRTTFIARLPGARRWYQRYLPLMPAALEALDLSAFDLVICCEAGPAKGVIVRPGALQVAYCFSPMRYIWDKYHVYRRGAGRLTRFLMPFFAHRLRLWDAVSAMRVDTFVADSAFVAQRIRQYYRREAEVVYPPVDLAAFAPVPATERGDFYLWCGEFAAYKRPEVAVEAFARLGRPLVMIGGGDQFEQLKRRAGPNVRFLGKASDDVLRHHMARCRALVFPGEEDFGIVPVEAQAAGRPVIALGRGGALETIIPDETGILYADDSVEGLMEAIGRFEQSGLTERCEQACVANASRFGIEAFKAGMTRVLREHGITPPPAVGAAIG